MTRKNRKFSGASIARYSAKVGKTMKAISDDETKAKVLTDNATYRFAISQGGYHVLRENISMMLDKAKVPGPARIPFYAMVQHVYKMITEDDISPSEVMKEKEVILDKYFTRGTPIYEIADQILIRMLSTGKDKGAVKIEPVKKDNASTAKTSLGIPPERGE